MKHILMLHGWGFPAAVFHALKERLSVDFAVTSPNRPGYGSEADEADYYPDSDPGSDSYPDQETLLSTDSPVLLGWSLGALTALQLAVRQPDSISGLILLAATPCFVNRPDWTAGMDTQVFSAFRRQVDEDPAVAMQQFVRLNSGHRPERSSLAMLSAMSSTVAKPELQQGLNELAETDLRNSVSAINIPVLLLHAADDRLVPPEASLWLAGHLPDAKRIEFSTGGHAFFLSQVDQVAQYIRGMA